MKKIVNLFKSQVIFVVALLTMLCIGVIRMTLIMAESLQLAQEMQRKGMPSQNNDIKTAMYFSVLLIMFVMFTLVLCMSRVITRNNNHWNYIFDEDRKKRMLVRILFEAIEDGCPVPEEKELWELLSDMSVEQITESLEQLHKLRGMYDNWHCIQAKGD